MEVICPNLTCRYPNPSSARFCQNCGQQLTTEPVRQTPEEKALSELAPTPLTKGEQVERRQLTVLFCDLVDSTSLSENLDPEDYMRMLRAFQKMCGDIVDRYGGHVAQYLGDGVLIYFGHPVAHEDDPRRAVQTALGIQTGMENLNQGFLQEGIPGLSVRMGVHTGEVIVGPDQLAVGETPNIAARVQGLADPNTIVITDVTYRLVIPYLTCQDLGKHRLKGLERQVQLYQVIEETELHTRMQAAATVGIVPLVGRDKEADLLWKCWERSRAGSGQVVLVRGEPGVGKSRLVELLKGQLSTESYTLLECYCLAYEEHTAFAPISHLLRRALDFHRSDSPEARLSKLTSAMASVNLDPDRIVPLLAPLVSLPPETGFTPPALPPARSRQLTLEVLTSWLMRIAELGSVLLIVEDLHWMDPSSLELFNLVVSKQESSRMLMLLTFRPEFQTQWPRRKGLCELDLTGLKEEETAVLATRVAHDRRLPEEVLQEIVTRTDGVPLFVEELTKSILESGILRPVNGSYALSGPIPERAIPVTLQDSLMARLDRLGNAKTLAQLGSTIGRDFRHDVFQAVAEIGEVEIEHGMARLIEANLVTRAGMPPRATYSFKHALVQETAYRSLLKNTRQQYHQRIASVLTERFPEVAETLPELLAHHFTEAGKARQGTEYWQKAGQRALERAANREAIAHLRNALTSLQSLQDTRERRETELGLQLSLMPAHMAIRGWASGEVEACCVRARDLCIELGDHQRLVGALWGLWTVHLLRAELDAALDYAEQVLNMASGAGVKMLEVMGHHAVGFTQYFRGELVETKKHAAEGIRLFDPETERQIVQTFQFSSTMALRFFLSASLWFLGKPEECWQERKKASSLIGELNHKPSRAAFLSFELCFYLYARDPTGMKQAVGELMKLSEEEGFLLYVPVGMMYLGWALAEEGNTEEGLRQMEQGKDLYCSRGNRIKYVEVLVMYAEILQRAGRMEDALRALKKGMIHANTRQEHLLEPELYRLQGEILCQILGDTASEAEIALRKAVDLARKQRTKWLELRGTINLCRLWQAQGEKDKAQSALQQIYNWFTEGHETKDLLEAKNLLNQLGR